MRGILTNFDPKYYILAILVLFLHQLVWAFTWKITLLEKNVNVKIKDIYRAVITSYFFGTFLPSSLGPDVILAFNIGKSLPKKEHAPSSLLFIRLMNVTSTFLASGIVLFFIAKTIVLKHVLVLTWILLLAIWTCLWIAVHQKIRNIVETLSHKHKWFSLLHKIFDSFATFGADSKVTLRVWLSGLCMAFLKVLMDYLISISLGIRIPYLWFVALVPSVMVVSMIPISIAGLGVRESAYVGIFSNMGIQAAKSFSISLVTFTLNIWLCVIGGILYLVHGSYVKSHIPTQEENK
jgi:uncharacterized protein (TIRG00374 family)